MTTKIQQELSGLEESIGDLQSFMHHCYFDTDIGHSHEFLSTIIDFARAVQSNAQHLKDNYSIQEIEAEVNV